MSDIPPITGVAEIVLNVRDLSTMRAFYRDVLGFPVHSEACHDVSEIATPGGEPTICFLVVRESTSPLGRHGHPELLVLIDRERHVFAKRFTGHNVAHSTLNHLAFEIPPDSAEWHRARLVDLGYEPVDTAFPAMQARAMFIRDPEGNSIELIWHDA
ncbi:MAG: VOC family protein [Planctomycetota bacterium]